jgi:predicted esterase
LKRLHEADEKWALQGLAPMSGTVREVEGAREMFLLLHGFNERGRRIYRKLLPYLPEQANILAPDGPFPMPRIKEQRMEFGHAWYFFNRLERKYYVDQELARDWLSKLVRQKNPGQLPLTIIGFSQGGYLAPLAGLDIPQTRLVIGIGCEFKDYLIKQRCSFPLEAIHGTSDEVVSLTDAKAEVEKLRARGMSCGWHEVVAGHEITQDVGRRVKELIKQHGKDSL